MLPGVSTTLKGHSDRVNVVRFLQPTNSNGAVLILSGSVDKTVRVWRQSAQGFALAATVEGVHSSSVNAIATCPQHPAVFASASADGTVAILELALSAAGGGLAVKHLQSLSTKPRFYPLSLALCGLPASDDAVVLAVAGSTTTISIYVCPSRGADFVFRASLSGHEDWVRSLAFAHEDPHRPRDSDLLLASSSQDRYIRLWRVHAGEALPPAAAATGESKTYGFGLRLSNKAHMLRLPESSRVWSLTFEALLMGHEDWVYTAAWNPGAQSSAHLQLLSCSADNSVSVWAPEESSGIWVPLHRFGEISDLKGASTATGSAGGLWNCLWSPDGSAVAALTKSGSWRIWRHDTAQDRWRPVVGVSGHTKDATGISWAPDGSYLLSTSLDQTTRLFARWTAGGAGSWHEFSRPQIHGYDINCIDSVGPNRFVSGAEEKLLRVFDEPKAIAAMLESLCGAAPAADTAALPNAANLPVLGLSNKPIDEAAPAPMDDGHIPGDDGDDDAADADAGTATDKKMGADHALPADGPPLENHLSRHTLWPEADKLYGHGYEISALAASPTSQLIATACKASTVEHAVIRLYDGSNGGWREIKPPLQSHSLTVTSLAFSPCGQHLLSVGRDRAWTVSSHENGKWTLTQRKDKAHTRIIYDCAWLSGGAAFVTVSRDRSAKIWARASGSGGEEAKAMMKLPQPVTAVDALVGDDAGGVGHCWVLLGMEDGGLQLVKVDAENGRFGEVTIFDDRCVFHCSCYSEIGGVMGC